MTALIQESDKNFFVQIFAEGVKALKPQPWKNIQQNGEPAKEFKQKSVAYGGINFEFDMAICEDDIDNAMAKWVVENVKFSVKQPVIRLVNSSSFMFTFPILYN